MSAPVYFKGRDGKAVAVTASVDIKEWLAAGEKPCDKDGKALAGEAKKEVAQLFGKSESEE